MAITPILSAAARVLSVFGDGLDNPLEISRDAAGTLLVNGGLPVLGGAPTIANTAQLQVFGLGGNDVITLNEAAGALPRASLFGGTGDDTITGGSAGDRLFGESGNDVLNGKGGQDALFGGAGNDVLTGGDADDTVFGEAGNDRLIWNPGDDSDVFEGGTGIDTAEINGGNGSETFTVTANGTRVRIDRLDPAPFAVDAGTIEQVVLNLNGGDDSFAATGNLAALVTLTIDGGAGRDTILGGNGVDLLLGGDGDDFIDGQQGNDVAFLGAGDDVFQWDPGDGSDVVEGQAGQDELLFNGSAGNEIMALSANGARALFARNLGNIVMDLDGVEQVTVNALGGTDAVTINDMTGTAVTEVSIGLAGVIGGTTGDGAADTVVVNATGGDDVIDVFGAGGSVAIIGLAARVDITGSEGANDSLVVNGGAGDDGITATTLPAGVARLTLDGGAGNDVLLGSQGADILLGGDGDDFVFGDNGNDAAFLGAGDDVFQWDPGDGSDVVEGQGGADRMLFFGSNAGEIVNIAANGGRVLFTRDIAAITMDLNDVETIEFRALGGIDTIVVGDLSGTDATRVDIDLRGPAGSGDSQADSVTATATQGADTFGVTGDAGGVTVFGLAAQINLFSAEDGLDRLTLNGFGGDDVMDATSLEADAMELVMNGGLGADIFLGSAGGDLINGGDGADVALMGAGDDGFVWNPGDDNDVIEGQAGFDTLLFNGANVAENIDIFANGGRLVFFRNIASVTMDMNDLEQITFNALGGADNIVIGDLSGTDAQVIRIDLGASGGGDDGQADTITVNGTAGDDTVLVIGDNGLVTVSGLAATIEIIGFGVGDRLLINGLAGDDVVEASQLDALLALTADGGADDDILIGSDAADVLLGGTGDDVLLGGGGIDVLDGGTGSNVIIQGTSVFGV